MARHIALFDGNDTGFNGSLWVTNGTAVGTSEIDVSGGYTGSGIRQFGPSNFTVFNGQVLFSDEDQAGQVGLWLTRGTAASTRELTGISGASSSGIAPSSFSVFNGEVLFDGEDASGDFGLWLTNGTAAGTLELTGIVAQPPAGSILTVLRSSTTRCCLSALTPPAPKACG
jgi:hypothetical protein